MVFESLGPWQAESKAKKRDLCNLRFVFWLILPLTVGLALKSPRYSQIFSFFYGVTLSSSACRYKLSSDHALESFGYLHWLLTFLLTSSLIPSNYKRSCPLIPGWVAVVWRWVIWVVDERFTIYFGYQSSDRSHFHHTRTTRETFSKPVYCRLIHPGLAPIHVNQVFK